MNGVLFIRHAETDMIGAFCGHSNPPINGRGLQQIQTLINALDGEEIECIFTSDLERAAYTASALADAFGIPCIKKPDLREINFGNLVSSAETVSRNAADSLVKVETTGERNDDGNPDDRRGPCAQECYGDCKAEDSAGRI